MEFGDLTTLITVGIAVFIFMRLRAVLGKRTGHQNPPVERYQKKSDDLNSASNDNNDNVVTLPKRGKSADANAPDIYAAVDLVAKPDTDLNKELRKMKDAAAGFEPGKFL